MKHNFILALTMLCMNSMMKTSAQGIYQYWGTTEAGGNENQGTIYTTRTDGGGHKLRPAFPVTTPGGNGTGKKGVVYNSKIYTVAGGGINGAGIIMAYDPVANSYEKLVDIYTIGGSEAYTNLIVYNNKMYGISQADAFGTDGFIFEFNPANNVLTRKYNFSNTDYDTPLGGLTLVGDELWGCASAGTVATSGGVYSYDLGSGILTQRYDIGNFLGRFPDCILSYYNNKFYGVTFGGGANNEGVLFEYIPATDIYTVRHVFSGGNDGIRPHGELVLFNNKFYGQTSGEGANGYGTIFEFDPGTNLFATKYQNTSVNGGNNEHGFTLYNNKLYSLNFLGGTDDDGTLIEYDPLTNAVVKKVDCSRANGHYGKYLMTLYNNKLYGLADGGLYNGNTLEGVYFEYNPGPNSFLPKIQFRQNDGTSPVGAVNFVNGKVFGISKQGGIDGQGVIWEYDLATYTYTPRHHFVDMSPTFGQGMTLYNGKLYGCTERGGTTGDGVLYSFDPVTYAFTVLHSFEFNADGSNPRARPVIYNNKLYGTCAFGAVDGGTIWEYNPANNTLAIKVVMSGVSMGKFPMTGLTELNGSLWGVCHQGGTFNYGTVFQYLPAINGIIKRFDFVDGATTGGYPEGGLTAVNDKLYGTLTQGNKLFEFDPASSSYTIKASLFDGGAYFCRSTMLWNEKTEKFYGTSYFGGGEGNLFEYDLPNNLMDEKVQFDPTIGMRPANASLVKVPAFVAPGNPGNCAGGGSDNIDASNWNEWVPFTNVNGDAVVEINANGNNLGRVLVNFYVHDGATRQKNGIYYLDRNITITTDNPPVTPVSVRLYIRKTEFNKLRDTPGSGVGTIGGMTVFKNTDPCSNTMTASAQALPTFVSSWGGDYVFLTSVTSFSTFYFAATGSVLPVHILSFNGSKENTANKLGWTASCDGNVEFEIERSTDGINFSSIGTINAAQQDCSSPFNFLDQTPVAKAYYRLKMTDAMGGVKYSNIILLNRDGRSDLMVSIFPNPVVNGQANLQISSDKKMNMPLTISDATGRIVIRKEITIQPGTNSFQVPLDRLGNGVFQLTYHDGSMNRTIRFIKQ